MTTKNIDNIMTGLELYVQPFNTNFGPSFKQLSGEVLIRHKDKSISAGRILKTFEAHEASHILDLAILEAVCKNRLWEKKGFEDICVNLHPDTIAIPGISEVIAEIIAKYGSRSKVVLEISEDSDFESQTVHSEIKSLNLLGIMISLDDFNYIPNWQSINERHTFIDLKYKYNPEIGLESQLNMLNKYMSKLYEENCGIILECAPSMEEVQKFIGIGVHTFQCFSLAKPEFLFKLN